MKKSEVYFHTLPKISTEKEQRAALKTLLSQPAFDAVLKSNDIAAVKVHVGEKNNDTHMKPCLAAETVRWIKSKNAQAFLTETSTLYKGNRSDGISHTIQAANHGFTLQSVGAPFIVADGILGNSEVDIPIPGEFLQSVPIAREAVYSDALIVLSHCTGHMICGFGAAIKNLGMGLASRRGKMRQHSSVKPVIQPQFCTFCQKCIQWCPQDAIIDKAQKAWIQPEKCIGCAECLAVCSYKAVSYNWATESEELQKIMAEYALGAIINKKNKCLFINFLISMTADCDCIAKKQEPILPDIGILASCDPVAVDQAVLDLTAKAHTKDLSRASYPEFKPEIQIEHGNKIGLGSNDYTLITVS